MGVLLCICTAKAICSAEQGAGVQCTTCLQLQSHTIPEVHSICQCATISAVTHGVLDIYTYSITNKYNNILIHESAS